MCGIGVLLRPDGPSLESAKRALSNRGPDNVEVVEAKPGLTFLGAVLHIQGDVIMRQPAIDGMGNILLWNGEVFGGELAVPVGTSDTTAMLAVLGALALASDESTEQSTQRIMSILLKIHGPFSFIFYSSTQDRVYFGRDPFGRRSLVLSLANEYITGITSCCFAVNNDTQFEEVPISGIFSLSAASTTIPRSQCDHTSWPETCLRLNRPLQDLSLVSTESRDIGELSKDFLTLVLQSVTKRVSRLSPSFFVQRERLPGDQRCFVGVLFSGGIDSLLLAAALHLSMGEADRAPIELINIAFDFRDQQGKPSAAPDRLAGIAGLFALKRLFPDREWRFVEIDVTQADREEAEESIKRLIQPLTTHMDLNIGTAFWFASRGRGVLKIYDPSTEDLLYQQTNEEDRPLLRLGEEGALKGVGREMVSTTETTQSEPDETMESLLLDDDANAEQKAPHWCRKAGCKRPTKRNCPGRLCGRCCEERMQTDAAYKCKTHLKGKAKREGTSHVAETSASSSSAGASLGNGGGDGGEEDVTVHIDYHSFPVQSATTYTAQCKALLVGIGADEQLAGYGRHRTVFQHGGYPALQQELNKDLTRLWQRNLGRDDRCIADHGREAWFPYLDEDLVAFIQHQPLSHLIDLTLPPGVGDKQVLRQAAAHIGLEKSAQLVKRAIQFGSLASKQTSVSYFGSRRKGKGTTAI